MCSDLMTAPRRAAADTSIAIAQRQWGDTPLGARRAVALERPESGFWRCPDQSRGPPRERRDQIHVPAALIAAAGVAKLTMAEDEVVFDIPTLLDATLELCEAVGHA